jgi:ATP-dependent DNA helicase DinG
LGERGRIAERLDGYELRPQQLEMAEAVETAFADQEHLMVEAGTGVGKSFAYLVPAIEHVVNGGGRVVISTHTIALQEQLIEKDIPFLRSVYPDEFTAVLVKGRSNYLGLRRLTRTSTRQEQLFRSKKRLSELWRIEDWAYETEDGSLSDLAEEPDATVWDRVRSDGDDCLGRRCPHFKSCFYQRARRRAETAQLLIVNHALLFSDLAVRSRGGAILPPYGYVILDEAHTVERVAGEHLGTNVTNTQVQYLLNTLHNERTGRGVLARGPGEDLIPAVKETRRIVDGYFRDLATWHSSMTKWNGRLREPPPVKQTATAGLVELGDRLRGLRTEVQDAEDRSELDALIQRCRELGESIREWHQQESDGWVHWLGVVNRPRKRVTLCTRPVDVGDALKQSLFDRVDCAVMTSATLTTSSGDDPFAYLSGRLGLSDVRGVTLGSPFNYHEQLTVYVEADLPDPANVMAFTPAACDAVLRYVRMTGGRAFVLFTSYHMMQQFAELLADALEDENMPLLVQGSGMPRSRMLERFRSTPRSVLFGTDSFWTGVDVRGEALSNVVIVKLPFAVPDEPVVEARIEQIRRSGGNPFMEFQIPEAVLRFRQGIGRLIRTKSDKGIIVILDPRVRTKPYGRRFLDALPECNITMIHAD